MYTHNDFLSSFTSLFLSFCSLFLAWRSLLSHTSLTILSLLLTQRSLARPFSFVSHFEAWRTCIRRREREHGAPHSGSRILSCHVSFSFPFLISLFSQFVHYLLSNVINATSYVLSITVFFR